MSRQWLALYLSMATRPKYRRLSAMGRGALLHVLLLAGFQEPEAWWEDAEDLRDALRLEGFPGGLYDELVGYGWLEPDGTGVGVHDWDAHQLAATAEAQRSWEARRKREWRRKKRPGSPAPPPFTEQDKTSHDNGPGHEPDKSGTPVDGGAPLDDFDEVAEVYRELYHRGLSEKARAYLRSLTGRYGSGRVVRALRGEHARDPNTRTVIGRMDRGLRAGELQGFADSLAPPGGSA